MVKKGYQDTELGEIPEDWEVTFLEKISDLNTGGTPKTSKSEYWGGSIRWMTSGEVHQKRIYEVKGRITAQGLHNSNAKIIPKKSIMVALAGQGKTRGTVAITEISLTCNQSVAAIIPNANTI